MPSSTFSNQNIKIKAIHIAHCSHSYFTNEDDDLKKIILNDWYFKVARQIRKFYPEIEIECWAPEKEFNEYTEWEEEGIKLRFFPVTFSPRYALDFSRMMMKAIEEEIKKSKIEHYKLILHIHEAHNLHGLMILTKFKGQKIIVQHHGGSPPIRHLRDNKKYWHFFPLFILAQLWENRVLKNSKVYYSLSREEMDYLNKKTKSKIVFQTMGIEDEYFESIDKDKARKELGLPLDKKIIIFIGRISKTKGIDLLIQAMEGINSEDIELKIIGYGKERDELESMAKEKNLKNVEFLGGIFGDKKRRYLNAADILVLPSLKEGAPVTVMEAMASNLPAVVSDVGGTNLMIKNGVNGILIKKGDPIEIYEGIKKGLKFKTKDIRRYAERYRWKKIIDDTIKDYVGSQ
jgi:glycosyltransferase involved in cell wall biosynthesis